MDIYITVAIIVVGIFLFVKDYFSIDVTSILIMAMFIVAGVLSPEEGFSGFNHPATITLGCMFVVSAAVFKSGLIEQFSGNIIRVARNSYFLALLIFCSISAAFSAFVNDAAVVALLIPLALSVCRETDIKPSRLLIPISFAALFGGTCTLIGTSTNILVSSYAEKSGAEGFGMFEFSLPALCLLAIGMVYLLFVAPLLLPKRAVNDEAFIKQAENYSAEVALADASKEVGREIGKLRLTADFGAQVIGIQRRGVRMRNIDRHTKVLADDELQILIAPDRLAELKKLKDYKLSGSTEIISDEESGKQVYEAMIPAGSPLAGNSLYTLSFRNVYRASVLAIRQRDETITTQLSDVVLKEGDMMLLYCTKEQINDLISRKLLILLSEHKPQSVNYKKAIPAVIIALAVVTTAALDITSILLSGMIGCLLLLTTKILTPKEAYESIEWKVIFMMAGVLSMGTALEKTGGAEIIGQFIFSAMGDLDPRITLSAIFLVSFLSTNVLSSKATAALMTPIVISLSASMQISEKPLLIAVMFACSLTFMTPMSYPTNTMVYSIGNYQFNDFLKVGTPLNILIWIAASFIIPMFFPF